MLCRECIPRAAPPAELSMIIVSEDYAKRRLKKWSARTAWNAVA